MPTAIVTAGPTREKIDPVRFISNFSSGKQGYAIARALKESGFDVTLVSGPVNLPAPDGIKIINVETAEEMLAACLAALPVDVAVCAAAVCDFRPESIAPHKLKKQEGAYETTLKFIRNPDILQIISMHGLRPKIVAGFAAETENLLENASRKLQEKKCDIIVANDVGGGAVFGSDNTSACIITHSRVKWHDLVGKDIIAAELVQLICEMLS